MTYFHDIPLDESREEFAWDPDEVRDLIQTTPLRFDDEGAPVGYMAEKLFGFEGAYLGGHLS